MKKTLLSTILLFAICSVQASDTITVSQVFEFAVGDTFDYLLTGNNHDLNVNDSTYTRYVLLSRQVYIPGDSFTDTWGVLYPVASTYSLTYHGIDAHIDAYNSSFYGRASYIMGIDTPAVWDSVRYEFGGSTPGVVQRWFYTKGLGETSNYSFATGNGHHYAKELIYYNKSGRRAGTPYYRFTTGIADETALPMLVYPSPCSDVLHLSYPGIRASLRMDIVDMIGKRVYTTSISSAETTHNISYLPPGIYTWRITADNVVLKTGKVVKE